VSWARSIAIDRNTEADSDDGDWRFILMGPVEFDLVCEWLEANSKRPRMATRLFRKLFQFVDRRNQQILRSRDELAELVGADPDHVSRVMSKLVSLGVLRSERVPVPGLKGPGAVHWYLNPWTLLPGFGVVGLGGLSATLAAVVGWGSFP
jgi:hypothetical protein